MRVKPVSCSGEQHVFQPYSLKSSNLDLVTQISARQPLRQYIYQLGALKWSSENLAEVIFAPVTSRGAILILHYFMYARRK